MIFSDTGLTSTASHAEIVDRNWVFPGAFRDTSLTGAITVPALFPEVTRDHILAVSVLNHFLDRVIGCDNYLQLILDAGRRLAAVDPSGALVAEFDKLITLLPSLHAVPDELRVATLYRESSAPLLFDSGVAALSAAPAESTEQGGVIARTIGDQTKRDLFAARLFPIQQAILAELQPFQSEHSEVIQGIRDRAEEALRTLRSIDKTTEDHLKASNTIARHAPHLRILQFIEDWGDLDRRVHSISEALRETALLFPMFPPRIFVHATHGHLYAPPQGEKVTNQGAADDVSLSENTFANIGPGGFSATHASYDLQWGALVAGGGEAYRFKFAIQDALSVLPGGPDQYKLRKLQTLATLFPVIDRQMMEQAISQLSDRAGNFSPQLVEYLSNRDAWFGPVMRRDKEWLISEPDQDFIAFLADVHSALSDPEQKPIPESSLENIDRLGGILSDSLFLNSRCEEMIVALVEMALKSGVRFADLNVSEYAGVTMEQWIEDQMRDSGNTQALKMCFEPVGNGAVKPSEYFTSYVLQLIDPTSLPHFQGDDDREYQEEKIRQRRSF